MYQDDDDWLYGPAEYTDRELREAQIILVGLLAVLGLIVWGVLALVQAG